MNNRPSRYYPGDPRQSPSDPNAKPGESLLDWVLRTHRAYIEDPSPEESQNGRWVDLGKGWREYRFDADPDRRFK